MALRARTESGDGWVGRALVAGLCLLALAACGGGGGSGGGGRLSSDELTKEADAICTGFERQSASFRQPSDYGELAAYSRKTHDALAKGLRQLRSLRPPADKAKLYRQWLTAGDRALARIARLERAAKKKDLKAIEGLIAAANGERVESDRLATLLGFKVCASGPPEE